MATGYKTGGRAKGTPNAVTKEIRERIVTILDQNFTTEAIENDIHQLEPEKRLTILVKLLEFTTPKLQATKIESDLMTPIYNKEYE